MRLRNCDVCGDGVNLDRPGYYRSVEGWEEVRSGGGAHAIAGRQLTGLVMHSWCWDVKQRGLVSQGELFDQGSLT